MVHLNIISQFAVRGVQHSELVSHGTRITMGRSSRRNSNIIILIIENNQNK